MVLLLALFFAPPLAPTLVFLLFRSNAIPPLSLLLLLFLMLSNRMLSRSPMRFNILNTLNVLVLSNTHFSF